MEALQGVKDGKYSKAWPLYNDGKRGPFWVQRWAFMGEDWLVECSSDHFGHSIDIDLNWVFSDWEAEV